MNFKNPGVKQTLTGLITAILIYLTFCMSTLAHGRAVFIFLHIIMTVVSCCGIWKFYELSADLNAKYSSAGSNKSIIDYNQGNSLYNAANETDCGYHSIINFIHLFTVLTSLLLVSRVVYLFLGVFVLNFELPVQFIWAAFFWWMEIKVFPEDSRIFAVIPKSFLGIIKKYAGLIAILIIGILLIYDKDMNPYKYDGMLYYLVAKESTLYSISTLAYYGHMAQGSAIIITFFKYLTGSNLSQAVFLSNAFTMVVGSISFYGLLKKLVPAKKEILYLILTAMYLYSPYVLGLSGYLSVDYFCANLFFVVVYFTLTEQWFLQVAAGMLYVCTKEPGLIVYGCLCLGILVQDFIKNKWLVFKHSRYYGMAMVAFFWLGTIAYIGMWDAGNSSTELELTYIIAKLKVLYVLSFGWLMLLVIVCCLIALCIEGHHDALIKGKLYKTLYNLVPSLAGLLGFTLFSIVLKTSNHARYSDIAPVMLYFLAALAVLGMSGDRTSNRNRFITNKSRNILAYVMAAVMMILMLISSYYTLDPVSVSAFPGIKLQNGYILSTDAYGAQLGDCSMYNRQDLWLEGAYKQAIEDALSSNNTIVLPAYGGSTYFFDGMLESNHVSYGEFFKVTEYWNEEKQRRNNITEEEGIKYDVYSIVDMEGMEGISKSFNDNNTYVYLWVDGFDEYNLAPQIRSNYSVAGEKSYEYRGWKINGIVFSSGK